MLQCGSQSFEATINTARDTYYCRLNLPNYPDFTKSTLHASINLKEILKGINSPVDKWLEAFDSTGSFYERICSLVEDNSTKRRTHAFYSAIFFELNLIGLEGTISEDLSKFEVVHTDCVARNHHMTLEIPASYPEEAAFVSRHNLPLAKSSEGGFQGKTTALEIYHQFKHLIETFQEYWNALEIFDMSCWVLEPAETHLSDLTRRIGIAADCSALLTFNPFQPRQCPSIEFRGSPDKVSALRETLGKNLLEEMWDPEVDIHLNLLSILDLECFPSKEVDMEEKENALVQPGDCGICFEGRDQGGGANERCQNDKCNSQYHQTCLLRYLRSTNHLRIRKAIMGKCPTCRESIGCSITT